MFRRFRYPVFRSPVRAIFWTWFFFKAMPWLLAFALAALLLALGVSPPS